MKSQALWRMYGLGYLASWRWIIVICIVPTILSAIMYLALLSKLPTNVTTAKTFQFATELPSKLKEYSSAKTTRWLIIVPDNDNTRAIGTKIAQSLNFGSEVDYAGDATTIYNEILSANMQEFNQSFDNLAKELNKIYNGTNGTDTIATQRDTYIQQVFPGINFSQTEGHMFFLDLSKVKDGILNYTLHYDILAFQRYHRDNIDPYCMQFASYSEQQYFSCYGFTIQNAIEKAIYEVATNSSIDQLKFGQLPFEESGNIKLYVQASFQVMCVQPFIQIFLIFIINKYRQNTFTILKRLGVSTLAFWSIGFVFSFVLCYVALIIFYGFTMIMNQLPFVAYSPGVMFVYALLVALNYSVTGLLFTVIFYDRNLQIIAVVVISLLVTQFPVLLTEMGSTMRGIWDNGTFPQGLTHVCCILLPQLAAHGLVEYLVQIVPPQILQQTRYPSGEKKFGFGYLGRRWQDVPFQVSISTATYKAPPIWYFYVLIPAQALAVFAITVLIGNVKPERKQSGLPFFYFFNTKYFKHKKMDQSEHKMEDHKDQSDQEQDSSFSGSKHKKSNNNQSSKHDNDTVSQILPIYTEVSDREAIQHIDEDGIWQAAVQDQAQRKPVALQISNLYKNYGRKKVLKGFNMTVHEGEVIGLVGASGSGKSTLLNIIADYVKPGKAETLNFYNFNLLSPYERKSSRPYIAICPQDKENIFDDYTIKQNVFLAKCFSTDSFFEDEIVQDLIQVLGLTPAVNKTFKQLSGGMQRRFGLLMTLLQRPKLLLLDEVSANVDPILKRNIWGALVKYREVSGCAIILASHDPMEVLEMADCVVFLDNGVATATGTAAELYKGSGRFNVTTSLHDVKKAKKLLRSKGVRILNTKLLKTLARIDTDFSNIDQLINALQTLTDHSISYTISSVQVNDLMAQKPENATENPIESEQTTETDVQKGEEVDVIQQQLNNQSTDSVERVQAIVPQTKPRYLYLRYATLSTWFKAMRSYFVVLLCSIAIIFLFAILEFVLIKSFFQNDKPISQEEYQKAYDDSSQAIKDACQTETDVLQCIIKLQKNQFSILSLAAPATLQAAPQPVPATIPPVFKYTKTIQHFFNVIGFTALNNSIFTFGDGSMFLNVQDDTYRVYIIDKNSVETQVDYNQKIVPVSLPNLPALSYSSVIPKLDEQQFNNLYDMDDTSKYFSRRFKLNGQSMFSLNLTSAQTFLVANDRSQLFNKYFHAQELVNESRMTPQQINELQNEMYAGIIDLDDNVVYTNMPSYPVQFKYSGLIKAVNNTETNQIQFVLGTYYSHFVLPVGANSANQVDADQPMLFNYNNDLLTRYYSYKLKKFQESKNQSLSLKDLHDKYQMTGNFITQPFITHNQVIRTTYQSHVMRGEVTFRLFIGFTLCLLTLWHIYGFNKTLDKQQVSFIDGVGGNVSKTLAAQIFIDFLVFTAKMYLTMVVYLVINNAPVMSSWIVWVVPPMMALQMISVSYVACIILRNFSVITFYCGINFVFQTIINSIIQPNSYIALVLGLFLPGFYYSSLLRSNGEYEEVPGLLLLWGILLSLVEIVATLLAYHFLLNKNKKKLSVENFQDESQILRARDIEAWYKKGHPILQDFSLDMYRGRTASLVSSNGAGKSTFIKCVTGFSVSFSGTISMNAKIGIVPQDDACYMSLTPRENVLLMSCFGGNSKETLQILKQTGLDGFLKTKTSNLGGGERRRLTIAMVLITRPTLLITDEVTVGLDSNMKEKVWDAILALGDCSVLNVTHDMHEIEALANQCFILKAGKVVRCEATSEVMAGASSAYNLTVFNKQSQESESSAQKTSKSVPMGRRTPLDILQELRQSGKNLGDFVLEECAMESAFIDALADVYETKPAANVVSQEVQDSQIEYCQGEKPTEVETVPHEQT